MPKDDRNLLEVLKRELEFVRKGGYQRKLWRAPLIFEDSPTCPNRNVKENRMRCEDCVLIDLVPPEQRQEAVPCRHIPLNEARETIDYLYRCGTQQELEKAVTEWLRNTIQGLEAQIARKVASGRIENERDSSALRPEGKGGSASQLEVNS